MADITIRENIVREGVQKGKTNRPGWSLWEYRHSTCEKQKGNLGWVEVGGRQGMKQLNVRSEIADDGCRK